MRLECALADVEAIHQPGDVVVHARIASPCQRIVALRQVDRHLLDDAAGPRAHHKHAVGERDRFGEIVGDQQRGLAGARERAREVALENHAGLRVDGRKRLVEQQHARIDREGTGERRALAHAA